MLTVQKMNFVLSHRKHLSLVQSDQDVSVVFFSLRLPGTKRKAELEIALHKHKHTNHLTPHFLLNVISTGFDALVYQLDNAVAIHTIIKKNQISKNVLHLLKIQLHYAQRG